ncbi:MAG: NAD-dependent epimerase/dehydratase family protein, partial [Caulobacteraceae bacterium]
AARAEGCDRFVFISSPSIFASFRDRIGIRACDAPARPPLNAYARTKLAAETLVLAANSLTLATTAIRPRAIVGPDDQVLLPRLADLAGRRWIPMLRRGEALIELTDVRDAADAVLMAEARIDRVAGQAVNVSGGRPRPVREVAAALAVALGRNPRLIDLPVGVGHGLAGVLETLARLTGRKTEPRLTRYSLATLAYSQTFDLEETADLIGYRPRYDGLAALLTAATGGRA